MPASAELSKPANLVDLQNAISVILNGSWDDESPVEPYETIRHCLESIPEELVHEAFRIVFLNFGEKELAEYEAEHIVDGRCTAHPRNVAVLVILSAFDAVELRMRKNSDLIPLFLSHWPNILRWIRVILHHVDPAPAKELRVRGEEAKLKEDQIAMLTRVFLAILWCPGAFKAIYDDRDSLGVAAQLWLVEGTGVCHDMSCDRAKLPGPLYILSTLMESVEVEDVLDKRKTVISEAGGLDKLADILIARINTIRDPRDHSLDICTFHASLLELHLLLPTDIDHLLLDALLQRKIISRITSLLTELSKGIIVSGIADEASTVISGAFAFVHDYVESLNGACEIIQAIDSGILTAIINCSPHLGSCTEDTEGFVTNLLTTVLARHLIYPSVIGSAAAAFRTITKSMHRRVRGTTLKHAWDFFTALLLDRMIEHFQMLNSVFKLQCSNCDKADVKRSFKRCAGCRVALYCSKECQVYSWRSGHRKECKLINDREEDSLSASKSRMPTFEKDRKFVQFLATHDARRHLDSLRASSAKAFPGVSLDELTIHIDYTEVPPSIKFVSFDEIEAMHAGKPEHWASVQRGLQEAKKSGGERVVLTWSCPTGKSPSAVRLSTLLDTSWRHFIRQNNTPSKRMAFRHVYPYPLEARWCLVDEIMDRSKLTTAVMFSEDPSEEVGSKVKEAYDDIDLEWRSVVEQARQEARINGSTGGRNRNRRQPTNSTRH